MRILYKHWHNVGSTYVHFNGTADEIDHLDSEAARFAAAYPADQVSFQRSVRAETNEADVMVAVSAIIRPPEGAEPVDY